MVELTDLDRVGPARSDSMIDAGYSTVADLADSDPETLAEDIDVPSDTALDFVIQAQDLTEDEASDSEEESDSVLSEDNVTITEEAEAATEESDASESEEESEAEESVVEDEESEEPESEEDSEISFEITFTDPLEYDTFFDALMQQRSKMMKQNRAGIEPFENALEQMRNNTVDTPVEITLDPSGLNDLHNSIRQMVVEYKGDNLIEHMDALNTVMSQVETVRSENLF